MPSKPLGRGLADKVRSGNSDRVHRLLDLSKNHPRIIEIDVAKIIPSDRQHRRHFDPDRLQSLATSIAEKGQKIPILVKATPEADGIYMLIAGERRWRAHQLLGRKSIFAIPCEGDTEEIGIIENMQRENLHLLEEARACHSLIVSRGYLQKEAALVLGKNTSEITRLLKLLELPPVILAEYEATHRDIAKSIVIEISDVPDVELQLSLWADAKNGATVKVIREARAKRGASGGQNRNLRQTSDPALPRQAASKAFQRALAAIGTIKREQVCLNEGDLSQLRELRNNIDQLIESASPLSQAGRP